MNTDQHDASPDDPTEVTIRVAKEFRSRLGDVVRELGDAGLADIEVHQRFLMISGSIAPDGIQDLEKVAGVSSVRLARKFRIQ